MPYKECKMQNVKCKIDPEDYQVSAQNYTLPEVLRPVCAKCYNFELQRVIGASAKI